MPDSTWNDAESSHGFLEAARRFLGEFERVDDAGNVPHLMRVSAAGHQYVIRQWPARTSGQVSLAARALTAAQSTSLNRLPVPQALAGEPGVWAATISGRLYSAATWLPGRPLARYGGFRTPDGDVIDVPLPASAPAESIVLDAVRTVGRFHVAANPIAIESKGVEATLPKLLADSRKTWTEQRRVVGQRAANSPEIRRWLRCGNRILPAATELLEQSGSASIGAAVIHGDLWPANLLIEGNAAARALTGVVGWSSVAIGSPLIDLAHLAIHTSGWSGALAETILGAYTEVAPLSPGERRLLPVVAALDLVPRVGWLLHLAYVDDRMIGHESQPVLRSGLKSLLISLENLTNVLAPDTEWDQRKAIESRRAREDGKPRKTGGRETKPARPPGSGRSHPGSRQGKPKSG